MPRFKLEAERRVNTGFSVLPGILKQAREKAGRTPLSSIIEDFLKQWIAGTISVSPAETTTEATA